tara:strand:+ start:32933 stop:33715 length:783 start_codon:yes stop_codon:yes gene_type:complete
MADVTYAIVFSGGIVEGFQIISVKAHLAKMLKASPEKMQMLFSGKPIVLKRTADKAEAAKYGSALKKVGADVRVKIIKADATAPAPAAKPAAPSTAQATASSSAPPAPPKPVDTTNLSLAPNEGNLVEPAPPPPAPNIDLSSMSVLENDGSPLVAPKETVKLDIDLSSLSVAENDGSPLVESKPSAPKVDAPDFGLDEPGAVLETLKVEVEEVHPDTSGMSLAFPGSDLLDPEDRDQGPPPAVPDTSKLSIVIPRAVFGE